MLEDFNLNWNKKGYMSYQFKRDSDYKDEKMCEQNIAQMVTTPAWSWTVYGVLRESLIDHTNVADPTVTSESYGVEPLIGDHLLCIYSVESNESKESTTIMSALELKIHDCMTIC